MFPRKVFVLVLLSGSAVLGAQDQDQPVPQLDGYVTRVGTPEDFDVNGIHVLCRPAGQGSDKETLKAGESCTSHLYGEHLLLFGHLDKKAATFWPKHVQSPDHTKGQSLSGFAVLDAVLAPGMLRADGYALQLVPSTRLVREAPLAADAAPEPGQWVRYSGKRNADGIVQAGTVTFFAPRVSASEQKLKDKGEFDPSAVSEDQRQSTVNKLFLGLNYKRVPAAHNDALQSRVAAVGKRLIPALQKELADGDPNKIDFRFQVVESLWKDALTLPNGIVLVPEPLAELLSDDQLAAVLAETIAIALEKQTYRAVPGNQGRSAAALATLLIPGVGLATQVGTGVSAYRDAKHFEEQCGRIALVLMDDAGFDIQQAPIAWWHLSSSKPEFMRDKVPSRAAYLFEILSTDWAPGSPLRQRPLAAPVTH